MIHDGSTSASPEVADIIIFYRHGGRKAQFILKKRQGHARATRSWPRCPQLPLRRPRAIAAHERTKVFPESTFFTKNQAAALPTPDEIRAINKATGEFRATLFDCLVPVKMESLDLLVKCGADVGPLEAQSVRKKLQGRVPVPVSMGGRRTANRGLYTWN